MTRRIFRAVLSVSFLVCIVGMVTVFMILFHYFDGQLTKELSSEAKYLALSVENYGMQALKICRITRKELHWLLRTEGYCLITMQTPIRWITMQTGKKSWKP